MKNLLFLVPDLSNGGAQRVVARLSKELSNEYNIYIAIFENKISYDYRGEIVLLPKRSNKLISNLSRFKKIKRIKRELLIDTTISFLSISNILNLLSAKRNEKTVISIRNYTDYELKNYKYGFIIKLLEKILYKKAWKIVAVSNQIKNYLRDEYQINERKIITIYNPYDINNIVRLSESEINEEIILWKQKSLLFVNVGRLEYQKNHKLFIDIIKYANEQGIDSKGLIIGRGSLRSELIDYIERSNITDKIIILDHQNNPFPFMKYADAYLLTSFYEGFPNALVESMICGCAAISVNCKSGPSEILFEDPNSLYNAKYGFLLNDVYMSSIDHVILQKLLMTLSSENDLDYLKKMAYKRAREFDISIVIEEWRKLIYDK